MHAEQMDAELANDALAYVRRGPRPGPATQPARDPTAARDPTGVNFGAFAARWLENKTSVGR
jgi:hypothetical protein